MSNLLEQINKEKKVFRLGDLVEVNQQSLDGNFQHPKIEYIDTSSVTENRFNKPVILSIKDAPSRAKRLVKDGDTIISTVRPNLKHYGFIRNPKENMVVSTGFAVLTPKSIDPFYLFSYLTQDTVTNTLAAIAEATTTTFPAFRTEVLADMEIEAPDLPTQKKIAQILGAYDAKIENNNLIIKKLEATAQTLFDEWFVNFRFPGYEKVKFVESETGEIPKKWEVKKIDDFCKTFGGGTPSTKESSYWENANIPWATPTDMTALSSIFINSTAKKISQNGLDNSSTKLLPANSILMTSRATVGNLAISKIPITLNQGFIACVCDTVYETSFLFWWLKSNVSLVKGLATGSTFPEISRGVFRNIPIVVPDKDTLSLFEKKVSSIHEHIYILYKENISLGSQRNQLLTKLI